MPWQQTDSDMIKKNSLNLVNSLIATLSELPLLSGLPEVDLEELASVSQTKVLDSGKGLINAGEIPAFLVFVLSGQLQALEISSDGRTIGLAFLKPGDVIGCLTLVDAQPVSHTVSATQDSHLLLIPIGAVQRLALRRTIITERLLTMFAAKIRKLNVEKSMLSLPNAFHRVFVQIDQIAAETSPGRPITLTPKQQDLGSIVNTSRETVSRALQLLIKAGVLGKSGHQIVVKKADTLKKLAADGPDALPEKVDRA